MKVVFISAQCLFDKFEYRLLIIVDFPFHLLNSLSQNIHLISQHSDSTSKVTIESFKLFREIVKLVLVDTLLVFSRGSKLNLSNQLLQVGGDRRNLNLVFDLQAFQSANQLLLCVQLQPGRPHLFVDDVSYEYLQRQAIQLERLLLHPLQLIEELMDALDVNLLYIKLILFLVKSIDCNSCFRIVT